MQVSRKLEQHIAVFGESGSGKTVLVSSFYGATQEPDYLQQSPFNIVADDIGQGTRLYRNYLGMRDSAQPPDATRFAASSYSFSVKLKEEWTDKSGKDRPFDALRLVWHDYPGEWFEQGVSGPAEARERVNTFRSLLNSDIAFVMVDAQRLLDNAGSEERYLKSLIGNIRNGLLTLKDELLTGGEPLVTFPRIWIMAMSKSDLLPDLDVFGFRDLLVGKAGDDMNELREVLCGFVEGREAMSVGEDFILLSSARFEPGHIELSRRVGVDLILPLAAIVPFERHVRWAQTKQLPAKVAEYLLRGTGLLAAALVGGKVRRRGVKLLGPAGRLLARLEPSFVDEATGLAGEQLQRMNAEASARHENLRATLTGFKIRLEKAQLDRILLMSLR